eukprot:g1612.t1
MSSPDQRAISPQRHANLQDVAPKSPLLLPANATRNPIQSVAPRSPLMTLTKSSPSGQKPYNSPNVGTARKISGVEKQTTISPSSPKLSKANLGDKEDEERWGSEDAHLVEHLERFAGETTCHGLHGVAEEKWTLGDNNTCRRTFWFLAWTVAMYVAGWVVITEWNDFKEYDTQVAVDQVTIGEAEFPDVTVCDINPIADKRFWEIFSVVQSDAVRANKPDTSPNSLEFSNKDLPDILTSSQKRKVLVEYDRMVKMEQNEVRSTDIWTYARQLADFFPTGLDDTAGRPTFSKFFKSKCEFGVAKTPCYGLDAGRSLSPSIPDNEEGVVFSTGESSTLGGVEASGTPVQKFKWTRSVDPTYGYCYTFSTIKPSHDTGVGSGLELRMQLPRTREDAVNFAPTRGIRLALHKRGRPYSMRDGITVGPGQAVEIGVKKSSVDNTDVDGWGDYQCNATEGYTQRSCLDQCIVTKTLEKCGCVDGYVPISKRGTKFSQMDTCKIKIDKETRAQRKACAAALAAKAAKGSTTTTVEEGFTITGVLDIQLEYTAAAVAGKNWVDRTSLVAHTCAAISKALYGTNNSIVKKFTCKAKDGHNTDPVILSHGRHLLVEKPGSILPVEYTVVVLLRDNAVAMYQVASRWRSFTSDVRTSLQSTAMGTTTCTGTATNVNLSCSNEYINNSKNVANKDDPSLCPTGCTFNVAHGTFIVNIEEQASFTDPEAKTILSGIVKEYDFDYQKCSYFPSFTTVQFTFDNQTYEIRTLDNARNTRTLSQNSKSQCQNSWIEIPSGWTLVPDIHGPAQSARRTALGNLLKSNPFGAKRYLIGESGRAFTVSNSNLTCTLSSVECAERMFDVQDSDNDAHKEYRVKNPDCLSPDRILIQRIANSLSVPPTCTNGANGKPCLNGGTIVTGTSNSDCGVCSCSCPHLYSGANCEIFDSDNACTLGPHGQSCGPNGTPAGDKRISGGDKGCKCICKAGFTGTLCDTPVPKAEITYPPCTTGPDLITACKHGGVAQRNPVTKQCECSCKSPDWVGTYCSDCAKGTNGQSCGVGTPITIPPAKAGDPETCGCSCPRSVGTHFDYVYSGANCETIKCEFKAPSNGSLAGCAGGIKVGFQCQFDCKVGYQRAPSTNSQNICHAPGSTNAQNFTPTRCELPPPPAPGPGGRRSLSSRQLIGPLDAAIARDCKEPPYATQQCATEVSIGVQIGATIRPDSYTSTATASSTTPIECGCLPECVAIHHDMRVSTTNFPAETSNDVHNHAVSLCRRDVRIKLGNVFSNVQDKCNAVCKNSTCIDPVSGLYEDTYNNSHCDKVTLDDVAKVLLEVETWMKKSPSLPLTVNEIPKRYQCDREIFCAANATLAQCENASPAILPCNMQDKGAGRVLTEAQRSKLRLKLIREASGLRRLLADVNETDFDTFNISRTLANFIRGTCGAGTMEWDLQKWKYTAPKSRYFTTAMREARDSALSISIYYGSPDEEVATVGKKTTTLDLFGNIGGMLGLLCGISLLTLFEFIEFIGAMGIAFFIPWKVAPFCQKRSDGTLHPWAAKQVTKKECISTIVAVIVWVGLLIAFLSATVDTDIDNLG